MQIFKACACRDPVTRKQLGARCPDLAKRNHGKWYARYEAPPGADGKRARPRIGPFDTEKEAKQELGKAIGTGSPGVTSQDRKVRVGTYLDRWHSNRVSAAQNRDDGLAPSTLEAEAEAIDLYLKPGLGHIPLTELHNQQIRDLYAAMRKINRQPESDDNSHLLRALLKARASRHGRRISTRPLGESRIRRVNAVLSSALNEAVSIDHLLSHNPASGIFRSKGGRKSARIKPLLWTGERVEYWERTGKVPAKVMTWSQVQARTFLDFCQATDERLYALYHLDVHYGPRRSELAGLERQDMSVARRRVHIRQAQVDDELDDPKSGKADRLIIFDKDTARVLRDWERVQLDERDKLGDEYADSGRYFTYPDGRALRPEYISDRFLMIVARYQAIRRRYYDEGRGVEWIARRHRVPAEAVAIALATPLPPLNFHGLRHGAATMLLTAKVPSKVISDILGHASTSFTEDVYTVVAEELAEEAAHAISRFMSRTDQEDATPTFRPNIGPTSAQISENDLQ
jgi:integrase